MARKIAIISTYSCAPTGEHVKKAIAHLEIRRGLAEWVERNRSIRRRAIREISAAALLERQAFCRMATPSPAPAFRGILGSLEVDGTRYIGPPTSTTARATRRGLLVRARMWAKAATIER